MVHTIRLGVPSEAALDFWATRLGVERADTLRFADPDGLALELGVAGGDRRAEHPEIPAEFAITGIAGARAYSAYAAVEEKVLTDVLGFTYEGEGEYRLDGFEWAYDPAPGNGRQGAGSVHHIAWASRDEDHLAWQARIGDAGGHVTDVRDRDYFRSIYFREPSGVLFEIATLSPGFAVDEAPEHLGEALRLPGQHEHLRAQLERALSPIANPRARQAA
jgi:glyoxalase family protein